MPKGGHMIIGLSMKERDQLAVFRRLKKGELKQVAAAKSLGLSTRWVHEKFKRYLREGDKGLTHKSRGRPSEKAWNQEKKNFALGLFEESFNGFGPTFAAQKLEEIYGIKISKETMRRTMIQYGHWKAKRKKPKYRKQRERKEYFGEMIQLDGSPHDWFEGRCSKCTLLVFIDDAMSRIPFMKLVPSESTENVMLALRNYIELHGRPLSLYVDFGSVFSVNTNNPEQDKITQFKRSCKELGIGIIHAHSPQAKGRVERSNGTHQDRLVKELRLAKISTIETANEFIQNVYLPKHNAYYAKRPKKEGNLHRSSDNYNLDAIFCIKGERVLQNDFTLQYKKRILQLVSEQRAVVRPKESITVFEHFNGELSLSIRNIKLNFVELNERPTKILPKELRQEKYYKPASNHPWRKWNGCIQQSTINGGY